MVCSRIFRCARRTVQNPILPIKRQMQQVAQFKKLEDKKLPEDFDYSEVNSLRREAVQKLNKVQPATIGQASRISGVSPADISVLLVHFTRKQ